MSGLFPDAPAPPVGEAIEIPWTLNRAVEVFLNRWCHRALGDRAEAERELRNIIALARTEP